MILRKWLALLLVFLLGVYVADAQERCDREVRIMTDSVYIAVYGMTEHPPGQASIYLTWYLTTTAHTPNTPFTFILPPDVVQWGYTIIDEPDEVFMGWRDVKDFDCEVVEDEPAPHIPIDERLDASQTVAAIYVEGDGYVVYCLDTMDATYLDSSTLSETELCDGVIYYILDDGTGQINIVDYEGKLTEVGVFSETE